MSLFEAALCELSGLPMKRVRGLAEDWTSAGFAALYRKAGLPEKLLPAFRAALDAMRVCGHDFPSSARLSRQMVQHVLTACETPESVFAGKLFAVLRRFEAEAAREDARIDAPAFLQEEVVPVPSVVIFDDSSSGTERDADGSLLTALNDAGVDESAAPVIEVTSDVRQLRPAFVIDFDALEAELLAA
jgi:hypothetical protein